MNAISPTTVFPPAPVVGQKYVAGNGTAYEWDGVKWVVVLSEGSAYLPLVGGGMLTPTVLALPPAALNNGAQFFPATIPELINATPTQLYQNNVLYVDRTASGDLDGPQLYSSYTVSHSDTGTSQQQVLFNTRLDAFDGVANSAWQVWNFLSGIYVNAWDPTGPGGSGGRVALYGQAFRQGIPAGQVGISMEAAVLECRSLTQNPSSIDGPLRSLECDLFCDGVDDEATRGRAGISVVLGSHTPGAYMTVNRGVSITGDPAKMTCERGYNLFTGYQESAFDCRQSIAKPLSVDSVWTARAFTVNDRTTSGGNVYICTTSGSSTSAPTGTGTGINNGGTAVFNWIAVQNAAWSNSTYTVGQRCTANQYLYQCVTPGSSTAAPTGTGANINNGGTAVFNWVGYATANALWIATGQTIALDSTPNATLSSDNTYIHASIALQIGNATTQSAITLVPGANPSTQSQIGGGLAGLAFPDPSTFNNSLTAGYGITVGAGHTVAFAGSSTTAHISYNDQYVISDTALSVGGVVSNNALLVTPGSTTSTAIRIAASGSAGITFSGNLGFFASASPAAQQTVSGAKGGNTALGSLIAALAAYGLIIDTTTA